MNARLVQVIRMNASIAGKEAIGQMTVVKEAVTEDMVATEEEVIHVVNHQEGEEIDVIEVIVVVEIEKVGIEIEMGETMGDQRS